MSTVDEKNKQRLKFLRALYETTDGDVNSSINGFDCGTKLDFDRPTTSLVIRYLSADGLVNAGADLLSVSITHDGVREVEAAMKQPPSPTKHFPLPLPVTMNVLNVTNMHGSMVQQGTTSSTQAQHNETNAPDLQALGDFLTQIAGALNQLGLNEGDRATAEAEIAAVQGQLKLLKPRMAWLRDTFMSLRDLLIKQSTDAAAAYAQSEGPKLLAQIHRWLPFFSS